MFGKNKEIKISDEARKAFESQSYWMLVRNQFRKNRLAVWALRGLFALIFIAIFGDFIANERPIYCKIDGQTYFPVFRQYLVDLGWSKWDAAFVNKNWSEQEYESVIYPPIPYSSGTLDLKNTTKGPFSNQEVKASFFHHWLGTDQVGRDIFAGMIHGTRIALLVGILAMGIAAFIGLLLGGLAGYYGDDKLQLTRSQIFFLSLGLFCGAFYGFICRAYLISEGSLFKELVTSLAIFFGILFLSNLLANGINWLFPPKKRVTIPVDIIVMRLIEIFNSIPGLVFLMAILAIIDTPSILTVMIIIGLIAWTGIARFVRGELLRIRALDYVEAARSLGIAEIRILLRHALPNALTPVLITLAFGIAGAILTEAVLSFLGVGIPVEQITWGKILEASRSNISAWWLAVFPGFAIFITVTIFNLIGEGLTDALNPKLKK